MFKTLCKKTAAFGASRAVTEGMAFLCLCAALVLSVWPARAAEPAHVSSSLPQTLPDGGANLNEAWVRHGGARLYWNTLMQPRQLRMAGASFADPAAVPELMASPQGAADGKTAGKSRAAGKVAPHSMVIDPGAPLLPMRGATRSAAKGVGAARADTAAPRISGQRPASASPALAAPAGSGSGKAAGVPMNNSRTGGGQAGGVQTGGSAAAKSANGAVPSSVPGGAHAAANGAASGSAPGSAPGSASGFGHGSAPVSPATQAGNAAPRNGSAADARQGGSNALPEAGKTDNAAARGEFPGHAVPGATAPAGGASTGQPSSLPGVLSGSGAAAGALGHSGNGSARDATGAGSQGLLPPPAVPSLSADDLLPPSNGSAGQAPVRAPLP